MLLSCLSTPFGSFFSIESSSDSLAWLSLSAWPQFSLLLATLLSHKPYVLSHSVVHFCPNKNVRPFVGPIYLRMLFPLAWKMCFQTQVFLLKPSLLHLMHTYWYAPSLFPWYFTHIPVKSTHYTIPIYVTTANILCALTMYHVLC